MELSEFCQIPDLLAKLPLESIVRDIQELQFAHRYKRRKGAYHWIGADIKGNQAGASLDIIIRWGWQRIIGDIKDLKGWKPAYILPSVALQPKAGHIKLSDIICSAIHTAPIAWVTRTCGRQVKQGFQDLCLLGIETNSRIQTWKNEQETEKGRTSPTIPHFSQQINEECVQSPLQPICWASVSCTDFVSGFLPRPWMIFIIGYAGFPLLFNDCHFQNSESRRMEE